MKTDSKTMDTELIQKIATSLVEQGHVPGLTNRIEAALTEAERLGFERGIEAAAKVADSFSLISSCRIDETARSIYLGIRALAYKEEKGP